MNQKHQRLMRQAIAFLPPAKRRLVRLADILAYWRQLNHRGRGLASAKLRRGGAAAEEVLALTQAIGERMRKAVKPRRPAKAARRA